MEGAHDEDELDNEEWALFADAKTAKSTAAAQTSDLPTVAGPITFALSRQKQGYR